MRRLKLILIIFLLGFSTLCAATPHYGINASYTLLTTEPSTLRGYQIMLNYDPDQFKWRQFNIYFDGGFSHFWVTNTTYYSTLNIYSAAPIVRYTFKKHGPFLPYLELSIGIAYLNHTHLDDRNFGMHFSFQDRFGIGALLGPTERWSAGLHAVHYSNGRLATHNSGITAPIMLDIGYRFE